TNRPIHSDGGNPTRLGLGFPIRTPTDQSSVDSSPRPIAASHVLHRRLVPRHPPYATITWPPQIQDARAHYPRIKTPATNPPKTQSTERNPQTVFDRGGIRKQPTVVPSDTQQRAPRPPRSLEEVQHPTAIPETQSKASSPGPLSSPPTNIGNKAGSERLLRKEVIQPHLPVRLPCYDFVPIASPTFTHSLPQGVGPQVSGVADFHDVTGGVYKARERIHRGIADPRLLATPPSWGRVADPNPN